MLFTIGISLAASLLVAIFLVPVLASKWLPVHSRLQKPVANPFLKRIDAAVAGGINTINRAYIWLLSKALRHRFVTVLLVVAAFAGSVLVLPRLDIEMLPDLGSDAVTANITVPLETRCEDTKAVALELHEYAIAEIFGAKNIAAEIGGESILSDAGNNTASVTVVLDLDNPQADSSDTVKEKFRAHLSAFPNAVITFSEDPLAMFIGADIDIVLRDDDLTQSISNAEAIKLLLEKKVPEVEDIAVDVNSGLPQVRIVIDRQRAYNMGLSMSSIVREIAASIHERHNCHYFQAKRQRVRCGAAACEGRPV
jgi:HAE1 family hydrophobic/amphiphilic exporter-1